MTQEEIEKKIKSISDAELAEIADKKLHNLCMTGCKSFTMSVPVKHDDDDIILAEVIKRFSAYASKS